MLRRSLDELINLTHVRMESQLPLVTLVDSDDWCGVFIDGELIRQEHSARADMILHALAERGIIRFDQITANEANLETAGEFADTLQQNRKEGIIE